MKSATKELKDLRRIPGIGPSLAQDLVDLGIRSVPELRGRDPQELYDRLCHLTGQPNRATTRNC
jgi:predicted flap endonuclease-1-like 5' DNA nuclease